MILKEKVKYAFVLLDKYICCDIKTYPAERIGFRTIEEFQRKRAKLRVYNSLKNLKTEIPGHLQSWKYWLPHLKNNVWANPKIEPWWEDINTLPTYKVDELIELGLARIITIKETTVMEGI